VHEPFEKEKRTSGSRQEINKWKGALDHLIQMIQVLDKNLQCSRTLITLYCNDIQGIKKEYNKVDSKWCAR